MILKVYRRGKEVVVAACDEDLLDKTFRCGELRLHVSSSFYGTECCSEEELIAALRACTTANLVGKKTIDIAVRAGFIRREGIINIGDVPHAQLYKIFGSG
jgi:hypothetical protein